MFVRAWYAPKWLALGNRGPSLIATKPSAFQKQKGPWRPTSGRYFPPSGWGAASSSCGTRAGAVHLIPSSPITSPGRAPGSLVLVVRRALLAVPSPSRKPSRRSRADRPQASSPNPTLYRLSWERRPVQTRIWFLRLLAGKGFVACLRGLCRELAWFRPPISFASSSSNGVQSLSLSIECLNPPTPCHATNDNSAPAPFG